MDGSSKIRAAARGSVEEHVGEWVGGGLSAWASGQVLRLAQTPAKRNRSAATQLAVHATATHTTRHAYHCCDMDRPAPSAIPLRWE